MTVITTTPDNRPKTRTQERVKFFQNAREHFVDYAIEACSRFLSPENATVVEIGCNGAIAGSKSRICSH